MRYEVELVRREVKQVVVEATTADQAIEAATLVETPVEVTCIRRATQIKQDQETQSRTES